MTIDNLSTGALENVPPGVELYQGDVADPEIYQRLPDIDYDAVFHIAGQSSGEISFDDPLYDIRTNAESTLLLLKYCLSRGCRRFIYASTMSVYGVKEDRPVQEDEDCHPQSFYGVGKLASEHYLRIYEQYGIKSTALRLFNVYGPGQNLANLRQGMVSIFLAQMLKDGHIHVKGSPERYRDFVHIDDVVNSFLLCLSMKDTDGKTINIATGSRTTVRQLIGLLKKYGPPEVSVEYSGSTAGDIHGIYADVTKMRSLLQIPSPRPLEDGIRDMVAWASGRA